MFLVCRVKAFLTVCFLDFCFSAGDWFVICLSPLLKQLIYIYICGHIIKSCCGQLCVVFVATIMFIPKLANIL